MAATFAAMMHSREMLERAELCEYQAEQARNRNTVWALLEAAQRWRTMALHMDMLEREPTYRMLRAREE
jgi:hypothetical protein